MSRPITTLFMLMSVDGKISTGSTDELDFDKDLPKIRGTREGLNQYYEIEGTTDLWSLNTGRVQEKVGVNENPFPTDSIPVTFVIIDNYHLNKHGVEWICKRGKQMILITGNAQHPAYKIKEENLDIFFMQKLDLKRVMNRLGAIGCNRITIQSGGTLNGLFLREKLFDYIDIVVAPVLVGGKNTPTLIDGVSITSLADLSRLGVLELEDIVKLRGSYLRLRYKVVQ